LDLIVDTHILLWFLSDDPELSPKHRALLEDEDNTLLLSAAALFEISTKVRIGKLILPPRYQLSLMQIFQDFDFQPLAIKPEHSDLAGRLPGEHKDPWDRMLAAQSILENVAVLTVDRRIADLGGTTVLP
jgi:PIN domain nuclease of toxin-antitoxin system